MKRKIKKQVLLGTMLGTLMLSGSFITVNAASNGKLMENIKDTIETVRVVLVKDGKFVIVEKDENTNSDEFNYVTYNVVTEDFPNENLEEKLVVKIDETESNEIEVKYRVVDAQ